MSREPRKGEWVLATEWYDGEPDRGWAVGKYNGQVGTRMVGMFSVREAVGNPSVDSLYRRVRLISKERAEWLIANKDKIRAGKRTVWGWAKQSMKNKVVEYVGSLHIAGYLGDKPAHDIELSHIPKLPRGTYRLAVVYFEEETTNA